MRRRKERAQRDENRAGEKRAVRELREADRDENERPELPELADVHEAEVVEREEDSASDEREADDEPGQGVVAEAGVFDDSFFHGESPAQKIRRGNPFFPPYSANQPRAPVNGGRGAVLASPTPP